MTNAGCLTTPDYWAATWEHVKLPQVLRDDIYYHRAFRQLFQRVIPHASSPRQSVLELGCAPGTYLSYVAKEFGYSPTGIDFSPIGAEITRKNLEIQRIPGTVITGDFLTYPFTQTYDIVLSLGVVEHFTGTVLEDLLTKHAKLVSAQGLLIMVIPNLRGINRLALSHFNTPALRSHNLEVMSKQFLHSFAEQHGLSRVYSDYFCSFSPSSFKYPKEKRLGVMNHFLIHVRNALLRLRQHRVCDNVNSSLFSFFIGGVFKKELTHEPAP